MAAIELASGRVLSYSTEGEEPSVIFLHGIMGGKKNLKGFVKRFCEDIPQRSAITFDLRNHGESSKHWEPFTVAAAAEDIVDACGALKLNPDAVVGHSFGGKVALMVAHNMPRVKQVWLLDCPPGVIQPESLPIEQRPLNTLEIIDILIGLPWPCASRRDLVTSLVARGVLNPIALWMTTNLVAHDDGVRLVFDAEHMRAMLMDFIYVDGWPIVRALAHRMAIHLVAAERGQRVCENDAKLLAEHAGGNGYFHRLTDAGHFVHADNPQGLLSIMRPFFVGESDPA